MARPRGASAPLAVAVAVVTLAGCGGGSARRVRHASAPSSTTSTSTSTTVPPVPATGAPSSPTSPSTARPGMVPSPQASCIAQTPPEMARYLGLTLQAAEALAASEGNHVRVVGSDGTCKLVTQELDPKRVDLYLDRGIVTAAGTG